MPLDALAKHRLPLLAGLALLLLAVATAMLSRQDEGEGSPSSYSVLNRGGKAAYLFLLQSGYPVERWEWPPEELPMNASGVTLILADPDRSPDDDDRAELVRFVSSGGKLLLSGEFINTFSGAKQAITVERRIGFERCPPAAPTSLTRAGAISQDGDWGWRPEALREMVHFADPRGNAVVVSYPLGKGEIEWWASALPLTNVGVRDAHNLELLMASVASSRRILWDEYFHADHQHTRTSGYAKVLRWGGLQLGLLMLVLLVSYARRSGPLVSLPVVSRLSPLEFVESMGAVFHKAQSPQIAVEIAVERLQQVAALRLGIRAQAEAGEIARTMVERGYTQDQDLAAKLGAAQQAASDYELKEKAALKHVREVSRALALLERGGQKARGNNLAASARGM